MKKGTKIAIGVGAAVAVLAVGGLVAQRRKPEGTRVRTAKVEKKDLVSLVTANGSIQARTKVDLSANIMGQITRLLVREGDAVKKGDLLLVIDQVRYRAAVDSSRSSLESLEAELQRVREVAAQASRDFARAEAQYREGILATAEYDRAKSLHEQSVSAVNRAERQVTQAHAELSSTHDALEKTEIRAPMDGIVTRRNVEQGEVVVTGTMNNPGTVLMTISDMSTVEAVLEVDQTDVPLLRLGQPAAVLIDAFPDKPFPGVVSEIGSSPIRGTTSLGQAATGTDYEVKVALTSHPAGIRPGLTVTADITTEARKGVMTVPIGALVLRNEDEDKGAAGKPEDGVESRRKADEVATVASRSRDVEGVYIVRDGKAVFKPVTTGIKGELDLEVVQGLDAGDEVVVGPFKALRELKPDAKVVVDNSEGEET
jgi:HlyD family secretion protein